MTRLPDAKGDAVVRVSLDWRDRQHFDGRSQRPWRVCGCPTHLREAAGGPACKRCVEGEIEARVLAFARTLIAAAAAQTNTDQPGGGR